MSCLLQGRVFLGKAEEKPLTEKGDLTLKSSGNREPMAIKTVLQGCKEGG